MYKKSYIICEKCGREIVSSRFKAHQKVCPRPPKKVLLLDTRIAWVLRDNQFACTKCNQSFETRNGCITHYWARHEPNRKIKVRTKPAWNKGLTKENDDRVRKNGVSGSKSAQQRIKNGTYKTCKHSEKTKKKLSIQKSLHNSGGRCKWYKVAGQSIQGTWERDIAIVFERENIKWKKPLKKKDVWSYINDEGKTKSYTPDFYLPDYDLFLEIKGYWWGNDKRKMEIVQATYPERKIIIIEKVQYQAILDGNISNIILDRK